MSRKPNYSSGAVCHRPLAPFSQISSQFQNILVIIALSHKMLHTESVLVLCQVYSYVFFTVSHDCLV